MNHFYSVPLLILGLQVYPAAFAFLDINLPFYGAFLEDERPSENFQNLEEEFLIGSEFDELGNLNLNREVPEASFYFSLEDLIVPENLSESSNNQTKENKELGQQSSETSTENIITFITTLDDDITTNKPMEEFAFSQFLGQLVSSFFSFIGSVIKTTIGLFLSVEPSKSSSSDKNNFGSDPILVKSLKKRDLAEASGKAEKNEEVSAQNEPNNFQKTISTHMFPEDSLLKTNLNETNESDSNETSAKESFTTRNGIIESDSENTSGSLNISHHDATENIVNTVTGNYSTEVGLENLHPSDSSVSPTSIPPLKLEKDSLKAKGWLQLPDNIRVESSSHKLDVGIKQVVDVAKEETTLNHTRRTTNVEEIFMNKRAFVHQPRERTYQEKETEEEGSSFPGMGSLTTYALIIGTAYVAVVVALGGAAVAFKYRVSRRRANVANLEHQPAVLAT